MHKELEGIRQKLGLYLGSTDNLYTELLGYITGYASGFAAGINMPASTSFSAGFLVGEQNFHRFVTERYGGRYPDGGKGWQMIIREHADDEQDAFRLFFELVAECEQSHPAAIKSRVRQLLCAKPFQPFVTRMSDCTEHRVTDPSFVMASPNERSSVILEEKHADQMHYLLPALIVSVGPAE